MISIDFVAGSHGHFLEYVCNKFIAKIASDFTPFNHLGASHQTSLEYIKNRVFVADHYSEKGLSVSSRVIRITFKYDDLLVLTSGAFLRVGDVGIIDHELEIDTYNKLKNSKYYLYLIDSINSAYPDYEISPSNPNCPRFVLREYFKFGFKIPEHHGYIKKLNQLQYKHTDVIDFQYHNFYNYELFLSGIKELAKLFNVRIDENELLTLWNSFISKQIFRGLKTQCDSIIDHVVNGTKTNIPVLTMLQESYINGMLEKKFAAEMPFHQDRYFTNTEQIRNYLCLK